MTVLHNRTRSWSIGFIAMASLGLGVLACGTVFAKATVTYWDKWGGIDGDAIKAMIDKFNKSQNEVVVKYSQMDGGAIQDKFLTTKMAGVGPDLVGNWNHRLAFFKSAGLVEPLESYLKTARLSKTDFIPAYWDMMSFDGKTYGMPATAAAFGLYSNKTVLAESGLDPETMPAKMSDMLLYGDKVTRRDASGKVTRVGFALNEPGWWTYLWPVAFGAQLYDEKGPKVDLKQPGMLKGYEWVNTVAKKWGSNVTTLLRAGGWLSASSAFFSGKAAFTIDGSWLPSWIGKVVPKLQYNIAPIPGGDGGVGPFTWIESDIIFLAKGKRQKEASKFLMWLMKPENQRDFQLRRETFSVVKAANTPDFIKANKNPGLARLLQLASSDVASYAPKTLAWPDLESAYGTVFWNVWNQKKSPAQALAEAEKPMAAAIAKVTRRLKK